jgi:HEAT repeat protein
MDNPLQYNAMVRWCKQHYAELSGLIFERVQHPETRYFAVLCLAEIGDQKCKDILINLENDPSPIIREQVKKALRKMM